MIVRPFDTEILAADNINETQLKFRYADIDEGALTTVESELSELFSSVVLLASYGGLSGDKFNPVDSRAIIKEHKYINKDVTIWMFYHSFIDPSFIVILLNLLHSLNLKMPFIDLLQVSTGLLDINSLQKQEHVINVFSPLPYEYFYEVMSSTAVVEISFLQRQHVDNIEFIRKVFNAWNRVAMSGGFADDEFLPQKEASIYIENDLQITSIGMQIVYDHVQVSETGFNVLTNILTFIHYQIAKLESVEIS